MDNKEHQTVIRRSPGGKVGRPRRDVSAEMVKSLHNQGYSFRAIASWIGVGYGTARRAYHGYSQGRAKADAEPAEPRPPERAEEPGGRLPMAAFG